MKSRVELLSLFSVLLATSFAAHAAPITWGVVKSPPTLTGSVGVPTSSIFGWVYQSGITDQDPLGQGLGIVAELGYGAGHSTVTWTWSPAIYNIEYTGTDPVSDEYVGSITPTGVGTYYYGYRFSSDGGPFVYVDLDGPIYLGPIAPNPGVLTVVPAPVSAPTASLLLASALGLLGVMRWTITYRD